MGSHMEGSDPHMEGSGVSNPYVLRDQGLFGASGVMYLFWPITVERLVGEIGTEHLKAPIDV